MPGSLRFLLVAALLGAVPSANFADESPSQTDNVNELVEELDSAVLQSDETVRVVTLKRANADLVQRSLTSVLGDSIKTNKTASTNSSSNRSSSSSRSGSSSQSSSNQMRQNFEMLQSLQRSMGSGGRGGFSGGGRGGPGGGGFGGGGGRGGFGGRGGR